MISISGIHLSKRLSLMCNTYILQQRFRSETLLSVTLGYNQKHVKARGGLFINMVVAIGPNGSRVFEKLHIDHSNR